MATDYVVRLTGKDDLSKTIKQVRSEIDGVGKSTQAIDKIDAKFNKITQSSAPLKRQLRDLQQLMAQMNFDGLANTDQFTKVANAAGQIKDAIGDAQQATAAYASDTFKLDAMVSGLQGITAATSVATGAMALFGSENKDVQKAILKVQAAMSILAGAQALANVLNKDSALMLRLKQIRMAANVKTTATDTVATTANTIATTANTAATTANTVAQNAWNVAKAIGKAMFGDFTGLVLLGVGAMTAYAIATSDATDAEEKRNRAMSSAERIIATRRENENAIASEVASSTAKQLAAYYSLQSKWKECNGDVTKQKEFMNKYKDKINETGYSLNDLKEAEHFFVNDTENVVRSIEARARAQASYNMMVKEMEKGLERLNRKSVASGHYFTTPTTDNVTDDEKSWLRQQGSGYFKTQTRYNRQLGDSYEVNTNTVNEAGLKKIKEKRQKEAIARQKIYRETVEGEMNANLSFYRTEWERYEREAESYETSANLHRNTGGKHTPTKKTGGGSGETDAQKYAKEQKKYQDELNAAQESFNKGALTQIEYKKQVMQIEKNHLDALVKMGKATKEDAQRYANMVKEVAQLELQADAEQKKQQALQQYNDGIITSAEYAQKIADIEKEIYNKTQQLGLATKDVAKAYLDAANNAKKLKDEQDLIQQVNKMKFEDAPKQSSFNKTINAVNLKNNPKADQPTLQSIETQMNFNDNLIQQLESIKARFEEIGMTGSAAYQQICSKLSDVNDAQGKLATSAEELQQKQIDWQKQQRAMQTYGEVAGAVGSSFSSLGSVFSAVGDESTAAIMQMVSATAEGVAQVIPQILALIGAKEGEALASGTASAAAMPYPANIAAIASIVATVIATFASIASVIGSFADGGIVGGASLHGDRLLARVNSGEMILNGRQQKRLFDMLDGSGAIGGTEQTVTWRIKGADLYGTLNNYSKIKSKSGKHIL